MNHSISYFDQIARQSRTALYLYIDIETLPSQDLHVLEAIRDKHVVAQLDLDAIEADKRLKDPEKIAEDLTRKREKAVTDHAAAVAKAEADIDLEYRKTALDASTGHIACIGRSFGDNITGCEINSALLGHDGAAKDLISGEKEMLEGFFSVIESVIRNLAVDEAQASLKSQCRELTYENVQLEMIQHRQVPVIVAHHANFDIRFVWQRAVILGVTPPSWWPVDARPWDTDRVYDTRTAWAGVGNRIGLDRLCRALGLQGKTGVDGSQVWDLVRDGRIDEVVEYCCDDVSRLRSVHRRLIGLPVLEIDAIEVPAAGAEGEKEAA